jgi:hypothetical protein
MNAAMAASTVGGLMLGLGAMFLLDPQSGRRRRMLIRDKTVTFCHAGMMAG